MSTAANDSPTDCAIKKLERVVFPLSRTSELQPLDLSVNGKFKHFINVLENHFQNFEEQLTIAKRETKCLNCRLEDRSRG